MDSSNARRRRGFIITPAMPAAEKAEPKSPLNENKEESLEPEKSAERYYEAFLSSCGKVLLWASESAAGALARFKPYINTLSKKIKLLARDWAAAAKGGIRGARLIKTVCGAGVASCMILTVSLITDIGYDVYYDGMYIGTVASMGQVEGIISDINRSLEANNAAPLSGEALYFLRLVPKGGFTGQLQLEEALRSRSGEVVECYVLKVDGKAVFAMESYEKIHSFLKSYKEGFAQPDADYEILFDKGITIERGKISPAFLVDEAKASEILVANVNASTYEKRTVVEEIPFDTKVIEDNALEVGTSVVVAEGKPGEKKVELYAIRENGAITQQGVLSEEILREPVQKVERVGTKPKISDIGTGKFIRPYSGAVSSRYGSRWGRTHKGIDIAGNVGDPIKAADNGRVSFAGEQNGFGKIVIIDHNNGYQTFYGHCSSIEVNEGDKVEKGQVIARVGNTGKSTGPHLHFEIRKDGVPINPENYIK